MELGDKALHTFQFTTVNVPNQPMANFDPASNYSWQFITATTGIRINGIQSFVNGVLDYFTFNTSDFQGGGFAASQFSVTQSGTSLLLNFTSSGAVPEPSTFIIWSLMGAGAFAYRRRKNRSGYANDESSSSAE